MGTSQNPCRCKIVGPTLAFILCILAAVLCWPLALIIYCCARERANALFGYPYKLNTKVSAAIPF